jgi:hypothetical protein
MSVGADGKRSQEVDIMTPTGITRNDPEIGETTYAVDATGEQVYRMSPMNFANLTDQLDKLNKQAKKLKVDAISYREVAREIIEVAATADHGPKWFTKVYVAVDGGYPKLNGWHFVATIVPTVEGNMLKAMPGETVPVEYRVATSFCDHCKTDRYRTETFVVRHDDGRHAQVGRNCLAKFIGSSMTPAMLAKLAEFEAAVRMPGEDDDMEGGHSGSGPTRVDALQFLVEVAAMARCFGFATRKMADAGQGRPTGDWTFACMTSGWESKNRAEITKRDGTKEWTGVTDEDLRLAQAAREHGQNLTGQSDFDYNLRIACKLDYIDYRQVGILAYAIEAYRRSREQAVVAAVKAPKVVGSYVGEVGCRMKFEHVNVARVHEFDSDFGTYRVVKLIDPAGNTLVWKTSSFLPFDEDATDLTLVGTVKAHDRYRDEPQTVLTRVKVA